MASTKTQDSMKSSELDCPIDGIEISGKERATFAPILAIIDMDAISKLASRVRQSGHQSIANNLTGTLASLSFIPCKVNPTPFSGSYNIVFAIEFTDGLFWMLKIPANGHGQQFDELASKALVSEARTMELIRKETTIPVPAVYAFDASLDNELHVPFILMERIDGTPLYKGWFNEDGYPKAHLEKFRARALQSLAAAMAQLNRFMLDHGGSIVFDSDGKAVGVGGAKIFDANAMWYPEDENPNDNDIFCKKGPFTDPKSALLFMLDRRPSRPEEDAYLKGIDVLLRMFIEWAYEKKTNGPHFVLTHPDFNIQNILVAEYGTLRGLIDWDGVAAVPREVGCAQFPMWLMHDWIETQYDYDISAGKPREEAGYDESSPDELSCYRAMYAQFMEQEIALNTRGPARLTIQRTTPKEEADVTRRSLVMRNLEIATDTPKFTSDIVDHMLALIVDLTEADWEDGQPDCDSSSSTDSEIEAEVMERDVDSAIAEKFSDSSNGSVCSDSDKDSTDTKGTEIDDGDQAMVADNLVHQFDKQVVNMDASVSKPSSPNGVETQEQEKEACADTCRTESNSASLGWTRRLLRFGCNAAGKCLRRIAKIGHVLNDAVDEVAEVLTEFEAQNAEVAQGDSGQMIDSTRPQQVIDFVCCKDSELKELKDVPIAQDVLKPEQANDNSSTQGPQALRQPVQIPLIQPTVEIDEIPARNIKLLRLAEAEKKAAERAEKKAEMEEQEIWERIAIEVRSCGVPVEILRKHEFTVASRIIDTVINVLKAEQKQDQDLAADLLLAAEVTSVAAEMAKGSAADAELENLAKKFILGGNATLIDEEVAKSPTKVTGLHPSSSSTSTPESSVHSEEYVRSDDGETPISSVTSFSEDEIEVGKKEEDVEGDVELLVSTVYTVAEDYESEDERHEDEAEEDEDTKGEGNENDCEEGRMSEAREETNDHRHPAYIECSNQEDGPVKSFAHSKVYDLRSGEWVKAVKVDKATKSGTTSVIGQDVGYVEFAEENTAGGDNESEAADEVGAEDEDEDEDAPHQQAEFVDSGGFDTWTIINVLGKGDLDNLRMLRLKEGFFKLLEQC